MRGDARRLPLPDGCVDLVVTSPPFWQLRSYTDNGVHYDGQVGSEPTPREYIDSLLACTREWVRVLKPSGSLFVELGDKYDSGTTTARINPGTVKDGQGQGWNQGTPRVSLGRPKSLIGLPWRYAIRCIDELGLILRAEIVWHHLNGLPESVTDRTRRAHSTVFHFTVQPRYYAAVDEIREPHEERFAANHKPGSQNGHKTLGTGGNLDLAGIRKPPNPLGKLPGSVWTIPSQPLTVPARLGVDHFAAYPMELPRRCVLGWSPPGVCTACGEGRRPVSEGERGFRRGYSDPVGNHDFGSRYRSPLGRQNGDKEPKAWAITGYACACPEPDAPVRPALVVDPFGGTGTTVLVAAAYGRTGVSVDLSGDYCRLARWRTADPAERARALLVPKPPPVPDGQGSLFDDEAV